MTDPLATIVWFSTLIASKIYRALIGLAGNDDDPGAPRDCDGSAKIAIIGIERSIVAWHDLISIASVSREEAAPFLDHLNW